ncbi:TPA: hypothetical protein DF272_01715 [Candidatus Falkowbacteria bacterium]|nr:hypothetical protein [Candidatus Falkowbacteria bacterium]
MLPSGDILNYAIAGSVVVFTIFLCVLLYNLIRMLRQMNKAIDEVKRKVESVHEFISGGFSKLGVLAEVAKYALAHFVESKTKDRQPAKSKK